MFEKLSGCLDLLMTEVHISADELARRTGIPASTIKKIRNHYNPNPTLSTLLPLAHFFSITLDQLIGNEPLSDDRTKGHYQPNPNTMRHLPLLTWEEAITWPSSKQQPHTTEISEYSYSSNAYALLVEEDHWENLAKGTALLVDPTLKPDHRDFVITYKEGLNTPTLKQILYDEDQIYLKSPVQGYHIIALTPEHRILGVVVEYKKHLKKSD